MIYLILFCCASQQEWLVNDTVTLRSLRGAYKTMVGALNQPWYIADINEKRVPRKKSNGKNRGNIKTAVFSLKRHRDGPSHQNLTAVPESDVSFVEREILPTDDEFNNELADESAR